LDEKFEHLDEQFEHSGNQFGGCHLRTDRQNVTGKGGFDFIETLLKTLKY
jgi:hypothetical protein